MNRNISPTFNDEKKQQWKEFRHSVQRHQIDSLYHCTPAQNIRSIFCNGGLLSRKVQKQVGAQPVRFHGWGRKWHDLEDYICLGFQPPRHLRNESDELAIIKISPEVIWLKETLFSPFNSAKDWMCADELKAHTDLDALEILFRNEYGSTLKRMDSEILVHSMIPWNRFTSILFTDKHLRNRSRRICLREAPFHFLKSPRTWSRFQLGTE